MSQFLTQPEVISAAITLIAKFLPDKVSTEPIVSIVEDLLRNPTEKKK